VEGRVHLAVVALTRAARGRARESEQESQSETCAEGCAKMPTREMRQQRPCAGRAPRGAHRDMAPGCGGRCAGAWARARSGGGGGRARAPTLGRLGARARTGAARHRSAKCAQQHAPSSCPRCAAPAHTAACKEAARREGVFSHFSVRACLPANFASAQRRPFTLARAAPRCRAGRAR
jgi:hypothetical protein